MRPDVTIVLVPRERYGMTEESLRSFYENTAQPFEMVCVTGGAPPRVVSFLREQARDRGFRLIETEGDVSPNHARNLGLQTVKTRYVAFADNDLIVTPGWLDAL